MGRGEWSVCTDWSCIIRRGRKVKRKALNRPKKKKKVANRILLGLHFVFVCRKKRKKRERKKEKMQLL